MELQAFQHTTLLTGDQTHTHTSSGTEKRNLLCLPKREHGALRRHIFWLIAIIFFLLCSRKNSNFFYLARLTLHPILAQWCQDINGGTQFDVPRVWTACLTNVEGILQMQVMHELLQLRCPSSFFLGDFLQWRWSERQQSSG